MYVVIDCKNKSLSTYSQFLWKICFAQVKFLFYMAKLKDALKLAIIK